MKLFSRLVRPLDDHLSEVTAHLLGYASVGFARILERAFEESGAIPAGKSQPLMKLFYQVTRPVSWTYKGFRHLADRIQGRWGTDQINSAGAG